MLSGVRFDRNRANEFMRHLFPPEDKASLEQGFVDAEVLAQHGLHHGAVFEPTDLVVVSGERMPGSTDEPTQPDPSIHGQSVNACWVDMLARSNSCALSHGFRLLAGPYQAPKLPSQ